VDDVLVVDLVSFGNWLRPEELSLDTGFCICGFCVGFAGFRDSPPRLLSTTVLDKDSIAL
jgi:hypothetical protein